MNVHVVMTNYRRPAYSAAVLAALAKCDRIKDTIVTILHEEMGSVDEVVALACAEHGWASAMRKGPPSCNQSTYAALSHGFDSGADAVIALEDDTVPAVDFLAFCIWGLDRYASDPTVFSVCGYQRTPESESHRIDEAFRETWFTPWGWATWRDRWDSVRESWPAEDRQLSWDTVIDKQTRLGRSEIRPIVGRIQNIGGQDGTHVPNAAWHREHHFNPIWATSLGARSEVWHEVPAFTTKALRRMHPC